MGWFRHNTNMVPVKCISLKRAGRLCSLHLGDKNIVCVPYVYQQVHLCSVRQAVLEVEKLVNPKSCQIPSIIYDILLRLHSDLLDSSRRQPDLLDT